MNIRRFALPLLVLSGCLMMVFRLNDLSLYTDSTRYLLWAQSLSTGLGWLDRSVPIPDAYVVNAPLYPLFIAPSQWTPLQGLFAAKLLTIMIGGAGLLLLFLWSRHIVGLGIASWLAVFLATLPMTVVLFSEVLSEAIYLLVVSAVLFAQHSQPREEITRRWVMTVLIPLSLLPLVREVGFALVLAVAIALVLERRWHHALFVLSSALLVFLVWTARNMLIVGTPDTAQATNVQFFFQRVLSDGDESMFVELWRRVVANVDSYRFELGGMMLMPIPFPLIQAPSEAFRAVVGFLQAIKPWLFVLFIPILVFGAVRHVRNHSSGLPVVIFIGLSLAIVLLYPVQDVRFLFPLIPFAFLWIGLAYRAWFERFGRPVVILGILTAAGVGCVNLYTTFEVLQTNQRYLANVSTARSGTEPFAGRGYFGTPWELTGSWISGHTPADAVIGASAKEIAPFVGERKVLEINKAVPRPMFEEMIRDFDVSVLVTTDLLPGHAAQTFNMSESRRFSFSHQATFGSLRVFAVEQRWPFENPQHSVGRPPFPASGEDSLLRRARWLILRGEYAGADSVLVGLRRADPSSAEFVFQQVVSAGLSGRAEAARAISAILFKTPRSTSYLPVARVLTDLAERVEEAGAPSDPAGRAQTWYLVARRCWDLGFEVAAMRYLDSSLAANPQAFEPRTWRAHFATQLAELGIAERDVRLLKQSDGDHQTVIHLEDLLSSVRSLPGTEDSLAWAGLYSRISRSYESMELLSDAKDACIAAYRLSRSEAHRADLVRLFEKTGSAFASRRYGRPAQSD